MIVFEIEVNGVLLGTAGAEDLSVLSAMVSAFGKLGPKSQGAARQETTYNVEVRVGGLTSRSDRTQDQHLDWIEKHLKPGDAVTIRILDSTSADEPTSTDPANREDDYRKQFEWAKKYYLENRDQFEGEESTNDG